MKQLLRHRLVLSVLVPAASLTAACAPTATSTTGSAPAPVASPATAISNPLFVESTLPYHAPRFDLIRNEHYQPALEEGMRQQLTEIDAIAMQTTPPTFDNTIVAM